jgi:flavin reductase ActVB
VSDNEVAAKHHERMRKGLREAMSRLPGGIVVVTTWISGRPWATTVSSCCSLSMHPPLLLICLANEAIATKTILEQACFGVNVLGAEQVEIANRAAEAGKPKFIDDLVFEEAEMGTPMLRGALASIHCELYSALVAGDHTIIVGQVGDVECGPLRDPLIYFHREFRSLAGVPR